MTAKLFTPLTLRSLTIPNRIFVSPMCQYSAVDGVANDWHLVHLGSRAVGGAGLVMVEATGVAPEGRITAGCLGLWNEIQMLALQRIVSFVKAQGTAVGIQLAHAGRKSSCSVPWKGGKGLKESEGGWPTLAPSAIAFSSDYILPKAMSAQDLKGVAEQFSHSVQLAAQAGFDVIELHAAHGYLLHEFLSPLSNTREDEYGGSLENRMRFPLEIIARVRKEWSGPLFVRLSVSDWVQGAWDLPQSLAFARELKKIGVDLVDCSSGGIVPNVKIPSGPGYQVSFAAAIRKEAGIATGAVGMISDPIQAEAILTNGEADAVFLARELLRKPYWPLEAAKALRVDLAWPEQYARAKQ